MSPLDEVPHVVVLSSLFPSSLQPGVGLFIRERMFRVGRRMPLCVLVPTPWFPLQGLIRRLRPGARPETSRYERQSGFEVWFPRFFSVPLVLRRLDGFALALGALPRLLSLRRAGRLHLLDAHFAYPDGYAAVLLGRWLGVPTIVTLRGTEVRHAQDPRLRPLLEYALSNASQVFAVSESLRKLALSLGARPEKTAVVGNGVDLDRFHPRPQADCRQALGMPADAQVLITVGGLVERKGFHRVIECLPSLMQDFPRLHYLAVGGAGPEGDWTKRLKNQVQALGLGDRVHFTGPVAPDQLTGLLCAADVFVLSTSNEGWANVFLEAMACGLPVVTTDVGGNAEVVCKPELGTVVAFGDAPAFRAAVADALVRPWDREAIRRHAQSHAWDRRVDEVVAAFARLAPGPAEAAPSHARS